MNETILKISQAFKNKFHGQPSIVWSPGRINLIGEHIDYNDGFVLPGAIDKGICYAIALNGTNTFNFHAFDYDDSLSITADKIQKSDGWKNYVLGVIHEYIKLNKVPGGFDCVFGLSKIGEKWYYNLLIYGEFFYP